MAKILSPIRFPKIDPANPVTWNRRYRRALDSIARQAPRPGLAKRQFAQLSRLIGEPTVRAAKAEHNQLVVAFMGSVS